MKTVYLILGGNLGDREEFIMHAIEMLNRKAGTVDMASSYYETEPWGMTGVQAFLNIALRLTTKLEPDALLDVLLEIEEQAGRIRNPLKDQYESRPIDIDILFYDSDVIQSPRLTIPHPHMQSRKFVLEPLCEIAPDFMHPVMQKTVTILLKECTDKLETAVFKPYIL